MASFRELQKKCRNLHLKPCAGKGVDKSFLKTLLSSYEKSTSFYEDQIRRSNLSLYELISFLVPSLPHPHPKEAKEFYGLTDLPSFDPWKFVYEELESLSRETAEGEEDLFLFEALLNNSDSLLPLSKKEDVIVRFLASYPSLLWLLERLGSGIWKIYVSAKQIEKIKEMDEEYVSSVIPFIRGREVARLLLSKNPRAHVKGKLSDVIRRKQIGETLWLIQKERTLDVELSPLILETGNEEVILSFWEDLPKDDRKYFLKDLAASPSTNIFSSLLLENIPNEDILLDLANRAINHTENLHIIIPLLPETVNLTDIIHRALYRSRVEHPEEIMKWIPEDRINAYEILYYALKRNKDLWIDFFFNLVDIDLLSNGIVLLIIEKGKTEILKKMLMSPHFSPPHDAIVKAYSLPDILSLLLADGRADPTFNRNEALHLVLRGIIGSYRFDEDSIYNYERLYEQSLALLLADSRVIDAMDSVMTLLDLVKFPDLFKRIYEAKPVTSSHQIQNLTIAAVTNGSIDVVLYLLPLVYKPEDVLSYAIMTRKKEIAEAVINQYPSLATEKVLDLIEKR